MGLAVFSLGLYLFGVVSSYMASTIYHAIPPSHPKARALQESVGLALKTFRTVAPSCDLYVQGSSVDDDSSLSPYTLRR